MATCCQSRSFGLAEGESKSLDSNPRAHYKFNSDHGEWPSGKAPVFGTGIRGFESLRPSQNKEPDFLSGFLFEATHPDEPFIKMLLLTQNRGQNS